MNNYLAINQREIQDVFTPAKNFSTIGGVMNVILPLVFFVSALVFLVMLVTGGFMYINSEGNAEVLKKAKHTIGYSILGIITISLSFLFVKLIAKILNVALPFN